MRRSNRMCLSVPVMPFMTMARMGRAAWSWSGHGAGMGLSPKKTDASTPQACAPEAGAARPRARNVVETAQTAGVFSSLLGALRAAGLDSALEGAGPFTVFAPGDDAFAKVPAASLQGLLKDPIELAKVLKFHVVRGRLTSADLAPVASLRTLEGRALSLDLGQGKVGNARVVKPDVLSANGVIHVIDSVLLPS